MLISSISIFDFFANSSTSFLYSSIFFGFFSVFALFSNSVIFASKSTLILLIFSSSALNLFKCSFNSASFLHLFFNLKSASKLALYSLNIFLTSQKFHDFISVSNFSSSCIFEFNLFISGQFRLKFHFNLFRLWFNFAFSIINSTQRIFQAHFHNQFNHFQVLSVILPKFQLFIELCNHQVIKYHQVFAKYLYICILKGVFITYQVLHIIHILQDGFTQDGGVLVKVYHNSIHLESMYKSLYHSLFKFSIESQFEESSFSVGVFVLQAKALAGGGFFTLSSFLLVLSK